ncbi:hypothetical protein PV04_08663 [Phialophora macrospora]|uniref:Uncharacterized protein n=1 Tax=Phialophora macrospora TaxID=1851006 RepID=A0A0D2F9U9_9EURO|nr:hypothetical protein PV04_08663 [Phialophora macrospora]
MAAIKNTTIEVENWSLDEIEAATALLFLVNDGRFQEEQAGSTLLRLSCGQSSLAVELGSDVGREREVAGFPKDLGNDNSNGVKNDVAPIMQRLSRRTVKKFRGEGFEMGLRPYKRPFFELVMGN